MPCKKTFQQTQEKVVGQATELSKLQEIIEGLKVQQNISLEKVAPFMHAPTWRQRWEDNYPDLKQELTTAAQKWQTKTLQSAENEKLLLQSVAEYEENQKNLESFRQSETEAAEALKKLCLSSGNGPGFCKVKRSMKPNVIGKS